MKLSFVISVWNEELLHWSNIFQVVEEVHLSKSLHKYGKFKSLKNHVITSWRKFYTYSTWEILSILFLVSIPGIRNIKKRKPCGMVIEGQKINKPRCLLSRSNALIYMCIRRASCCFLLEQLPNTRRIWRVFFIY